MPKFFHLLSKITEIQTHVLFHEAMCLQENDSLKLKMWKFHSWGVSWGPSHQAVRSLSHVERPLVGTIVHGRSWAQPLSHQAQVSGMEPPQDSSPYPFQSPSAVGVFPTQVPDTQEQRSHPCVYPVWISNQRISEHIRWLLLHPSKLGVTCYVATDNLEKLTRRARISKTLNKKRMRGSSWTNSIKMLESALCHKPFKSKSPHYNFWLRDSMCTLPGYC